MKTSFIFRWISGIVLLLGLINQNIYAYIGEDSRNGYDLPAKGTLRVLVVFAEVTDAPNYNSDTWPWEAGKMPPAADQMFDTDWLTYGGIIVGGGLGLSDRPVTPAGPPPAPTKRFSCFFHDASFGKLNVKGDYYPELVKIPYSSVLNGANCDSLVIEILASKTNPTSATGLKIPADFDAWTPTASYVEKDNTSDGKIDNLIIIWRINSHFATVNGSGRWVYLPQVNYVQSICCYDFLSNTVVPHELSHGFLGDNQYHNGGAGGGTRHFMTDVGGYGILESYNNNLRSCNAWDRYRLGWKKNDAYPDIYACNTVGEIANGDISYRIPNPAEFKNAEELTVREYVLRDFLTTGDALRIKLPYVGQNGEDPQWIWVENHVKDSLWAYYPTGASHPMGVRINLQIGGDDFKSCNYFYTRTNYYVPFSRFGRWDFDISQINGDYKASTTSTKSNAFTGNSLLESLKYDANGDGKLQDREEVTIKEVYKDNVRIGGDHPIFGNAYDVFRVGDTLSLATNPATTPWLTHKTITKNDACTPADSRDNRKIYLNGLRIHIKEKRADGSVVVVVTQGYYRVNQDQRWCGDIVLNEKISLGAGKKIHLDLGTTPIVKTMPIIIGNKRYFTEPTVLTCKANSVLSLDKDSKIEIDDYCALVLEQGSIVEKKATSGVATIHVKSGGTLIVESGVTFKNGKIILKIDAGGYACVDGSVASNFIIDNSGTLNAIQSYLQRVKDFNCRSDRGAKSGRTADEPEEAPTPVYQSFFEGNPVYKQVGQNQTSCGYRTPINRQGLEGDTVMDGLLYHKLSVRDGAWSYGERRSFWVRESEMHDKVWVRLPWDASGQEFLAVDMTLEKGDVFVMDRECEMITLCDTTWDTVGNAMIIRYKDTVICKENGGVVDSVYYLEHPGGVLKHIRLSPKGNGGYPQALEDVHIHGNHCNWRSHHLEFIEGVGSNLGFVYHRWRAAYNDSVWGCLSLSNPDAPTDFIICMERDGNVYYEHPNVECMDCDDKIFDEWYYEPDDPRGPQRPANERVQSMSRHLLVSPNPAAETATLQWDAMADSRVSTVACRILLYDMQGVRLRSFAVDRWPYTLSVSDLASGAYLLRVVPVEVPADGAWQATVRLMVR